MRRVTPLFLALSMMFVACSDDEKAQEQPADTGTYATGHSPETLLNDLGTDARVEICAEVRRLPQDLFTDEEQVRGACGSYGFLTARLEDDPGLCMENYEACLAADYDEEAFWEQFEDLCRLDDITPTCGATVGQFDACVGEELERLDRLANAFDCAEETVRPLEYNDAAGPACSALLAACPGYFPTFEDDD